MAGCSGCDEAGAKYRVKNPQTGRFYPEKFCKRCRGRMVAALRKAGGKMELNALMNGLAGGLAPVEANPEKPGSKARFDRHRQAPLECFHLESYRTVPLKHTNYPETGPYNVPGALAVTSRIKSECAAKYAERGVRVRYRMWAIQSILTPKSVGLRPTRSERALENPAVIYTVPFKNVWKYGHPFVAMRDWHKKKIGSKPKISNLFKNSGPVEELGKVGRAIYKKTGIPMGLKDVPEAISKKARNPADYTIVSEGPDVMGFDKRPVYVITVRLGKGVKIKDAVVDVANHAYEKGWGGTPTVGEVGKSHVKFTFKEHDEPSGGTTYEDYKEAVEGEGWAIGDYKDMLSKARSDKEKAVLGHILKEEQEHLDELQSLIAEKGTMPPADNPAAEANRHYTAKERGAITRTPEFKAWVKTRTAAGFKPAKQGAFHAFMTDVGKGAVKRPLPVWKKDPTRADLKKEDVPSMKRYYHGLGTENTGGSRPVKLDAAFNAIRDLFHFNKGRVPDKAVKTALKLWPRYFGKANVKKAWKELKDDDFVVKKGKVWEWPMMLPEATEGTTYMNPTKNYIPELSRPGDPFEL